MSYQFGIFSRYLSDHVMAAIVSDKALIEKMLLFETALTAAQAHLGLIPEKNAAEIKKVLGQLTIDPSDLGFGTFQNGIPVITLLDLAKEKLEIDVKDSLHYGATSQDVMDTAHMLIFKDAIDLIEQRMMLLMHEFSRLIDQYGTTPCIARTRGQHALPITFEVKINAWTQPLQRQVYRLTELKKRLLVVQLGGAAGTLSAYSEKADELIIALAKELGLQPASSWHAQRDNISEFTNWLAITTGILGKMGADILVMAQSEINEVVENEEDGGKSSAMPHKNNPVLSEALVALAKINAGLQSQVLLGMIHANERDATAWILEWDAIPQMLVNAGTSLNHAVKIAAKMKVNTAQMKNNVVQFIKNK